MAIELTDKIATELKAPFANVSWRVQGKPNGNDKKSKVVAYIDARDVMDRLDSVLGPDGWVFDWTPVSIVSGEVMVAKGTLTICGLSRSDVGTAGNFEKTKGAVSDALKRAAVHFGICRYLYDLGEQWAKVDQYGKIADDELARLNGILARRLGHAVHSQSEQQSQTAQQQRTAPVKNTTQSREQKNVAPTQAQQANNRQPADATAMNPKSPVTEQQKITIRKLCVALQRPEPKFEALTFSDAREMLTELSHAYSEARKAGTVA